ncbi:MAG TPA: serine/threonine-protein kinase, partial [Vicinamibacterales bacterium]
MIGSTLSHYVVDAFLGQGGMGAVYRARDTVLNRTVAIKVLTSAGDAESKRRLLHEARAASALNHPNIVTIHAVERDRDVDFIVMEYVAGQPLAIPAGGLPVDRAVEYADQIAAALAAAHEAGIVHRDVKPANVLITPPGRVKVLDFGIARRAGIAADAPTAQLTIEATAPGGTMTGTPGYMSPEQIAGRPVDARSDVFSLGVVLFEMLTGQTAFGGETTWARMDATVRRTLPDVHALRQEVPPAIAQVIARAVAKDPSERYPSARELHADLSALRDRDLNAPAPAARFGRVAAAAGVVLALVAGGAVTWSYIRDSRARWARDTAAPEVGRLAAVGELVPAFRLAQRALAAAPNDPQVKSAWTDITSPLPITSEPAGADVAVRAFSGSDEGWIDLGETPTTGRHPV